MLNHLPPRKTSAKVIAFKPKTAQANEQAASASEAPAQPSEALETLVELRKKRDDFFGPMRRHEKKLDPAEVEAFLADEARREDRLLEELERRGTLLPADPTFQRIETRIRTAEDLFERVCQLVTVSVNDWPEAFACAIQHGDMMVEAGWDHFHTARYAYQRCAKIYDEEFEDVERAAAAARERVADRIEAELGENYNGLPQALRQNEPQAWTLEFDWA